MEQMTMSGSAGCNRFRSSFVATKDQLEIGPVGLTKRYCGLPKGVMEQEGTFARILQAVDLLTLDGETLSASGPNGTLVFLPLR